MIAVGIVAIVIIIFFLTVYGISSGDGATDTIIGSLGLFILAFISYPVARMIFEIISTIISALCHPSQRKKDKEKFKEEMAAKEAMIEKRRTEFTRRKAHLDSMIARGEIDFTVHEDEYVYTPYSYYDCAITNISPDRVNKETRKECLKYIDIFIKNFPTHVKELTVDNISEGRLMYTFGWEFIIAVGCFFRISDDEQTRDRLSSVMTPEVEEKCWAKYYEMKNYWKMIRPKGNYCGTGEIYEIISVPTWKLNAQKVSRVEELIKDLKDGADRIQTLMYEAIEFDEKYMNKKGLRGLYRAILDGYYIHIMPPRKADRATK